MTSTNVSAADNMTSPENLDKGEANEIESLKNIPQLKTPVPRLDNPQPGYFFIMKPYNCPDIKPQRLFLFFALIGLYFVLRL
jgi:hypothetical protein